MEQKKKHTTCSSRGLSAKGEEYIDLKPGYVIFLCLFNLFGIDEPVYSFEMYDTKNLLHLHDGQLTMFLNTTCKKADVPEELKTLYAYLAEGSVSETDPWIVRLHNAVKVMEQEKEVRQKMTLYHEWIRSMLAMEKKLKASEEAREKAERTQTLLQLLLDQGRAEEARQALRDDSCRNALLQEYNL